MVLFAFMRNALNAPYSWLFRPRFIVFLWFPVEIHLWPGTLNYMLVGCSILLLVKMLSGFIKIRNRQ